MYTAVCAEWIDQPVAQLQHRRRDLRHSRGAGGIGASLDGRCGSSSARSAQPERMNIS